jgi:hypothetical protein
VGLVLGSSWWNGMEGLDAWLNELCAWSRELGAWIIGDYTLGWYFITIDH